MSLNEITADGWEEASLLAQTEDRSALNILEVNKSYDENGVFVSVLENISLEIAENEFVCILGESGCGKTTLLHLIAGLLTPSSGEVFFYDAKIDGPSWKRGLVFQEGALFPWLTVEQNISLGLKLRGGHANSEIVDRLLELMNLADFRNHYPRQISGGMRQRVALARALANKPPVLLFDEPFGALDMLTRFRLQYELIDLWKKNPFTAVFVTHDIEEALRLATRIVILSPRPGRIIDDFCVDLPYPRDLGWTVASELRNRIVGKISLSDGQYTSRRTIGR